MLAQPQPLSHELKTFLDKFKHHFVIFFLEASVFTEYLSSTCGMLDTMGSEEKCGRVKIPGSCSKVADDLEGGMGHKHGEKKSTLHYNAS